MTILFKRTLILIVLLSIQLYNVKSEDTFYSEPTIFTQDDDPFFLHTIERGQTVYSISVMYRVPIDSIYKINPGSKEGIREGDMLKIPQISGSYYYHTIQPKETLYSVSKKYLMTGDDIVNANPGLSIQTFTIGRTIRIPTNIVTSPMTQGNESSQKRETEALLQERSEGYKFNMVKAALLLPFGLKEGANSVNASSNRFVEYYEGFLMALKQVKSEGISVDLQVYDIGNGESTLQEILRKSSMQDVNLLVGGYTEKQIKMVSTFSKERAIPYVIPFSSKSDEPMINSHVFQINTPQSYLYSKASSAFCRMFKGDNIILYTSDVSSDKIEFFKILESDLKKNNESVSVITSNMDFAKGVQTLASADKLNVIVPSDDTQGTLVKMITSLKVFSEAHPEYPIALFGYPTWQTYAADYMDDYFRLYTSFYSLFYVEPTASEVRNFHTGFNRWYSRDLINTYPKFGILGYDTGMFFIKGLSEYGTAFESNIKRVKYKGIQTDFQFERINNWCGFINTNIYLITFNPNFTIDKDIYK